MTVLVGCACAEVCVVVTHAMIHMLGRQPLRMRSHVEKSLHKEGEGKLKVKWRAEGCVASSNNVHDDLRKNVIKCCKCCGGQSWVVTLLSQRLEGRHLSGAPQLSGSVLAAVILLSSSCCCLRFG